ncbi:NUDIX hydrolase [Thermosynechococcaceae cyanobacterium Okahandja]
MYRNPVPTVDIIIELLDYPQRPIVLIERRHPPLGWAIPGGFVDYGEAVEVAAKREAREEVSLEIMLHELLYVYSQPDRDPRQHTLSTVFIATAHGRPEAADDAKAVHIVPVDQLPATLCFDHQQILQDYLVWRQTGQRPRPA